jgi:DNA-binding beta-propeller fold protein YncE
VAVFGRDEISGTLSFVEVVKNSDPGVDGLLGAHTVVVSPDGEHVYVTATGGSVAVFGRDGATGELSFVEVEKDGVNGVDGLASAQGIAVSPDGGRVYVGGEMDDAVAVFNRNRTTGALTYVGMQKDGVGGVDGLDSPRSVAVSPDGDHVYVASWEDDAVAVFESRFPTFLPLMMRNY